jgi:phage shock protein C
MFWGIVIVAIVLALVLKAAGVTRVSEKEAEFAGVCAGIARRFEMSTTAVRILWIVWVLCAGGGVITYLILWAILPRR